MRERAIAYRPDIDGLRGLAVVAVVWFHSGLPGMGGGFTGVDVFFVISGYLITGIIDRETREGRFSLATFYQRRFRRIAPALVTVILATLACGYVLLLPYELDLLARSAVAAAAMVSNFYFWRSANYFAFADAIVPLLHTWTLGVEEQFYLLFPVTLLCAERLRRPRLAVAALGCGSFLLCLATTSAMPAAAFYLLPTRGWELMLGAALSLGILSIPRKARQAAGIAGLALILSGNVLLSGAVPFPGWRALLPTVGAALAIGSGPHSPSSRLLSSRPIVYVGRISYSFYLWHWPVFVFMRHWRADLELPAAWSLAGIMLSLLLAAASYHWIEQPARSRSTPFCPVLKLCLAGAAVILVASAIAIAGRGLPQRLPQRVDVIASGHFAYAPLAHSCVDVGFESALQHCHVGPPGPPEVLLWGDSFAAAESEAVAKGIDQPGIVMSMSACPPIVGWTRGESRAACLTTNAQTLRLAVTDRNIATVVLSAAWLELDEQATRPAWQSLQREVDQLNAVGKSVIVVAGVPDPGIDMPWASAIRERFGRPAVRFECPEPRIPLRGVTLVNVSAGFCERPGDSLFTDRGHPSRYAGLAIIAPAVRKAFSTTAAATYGQRRQ